MLARLTLKLGYNSEDHLLENLDSKDLTYWQAVDTWRTIGNEDQIMELLAIMTHYMAGLAGKRLRATSVLPWKYPKQKHDPERTLAVMPGGLAAKKLVLDEQAELEEWKRQQEELKRGNSSNS